jgi:membrane associated rhomboid family serine protease
MTVVFDMIVLVGLGRMIQIQYGPKVVWMLYMLGALFGGAFMQIGSPRTPAVIPRVGGDASISAMLTFYGLFNLQNQILLFFFPVRFWVLLSLMGVYAIFEPDKKNFGGMVAGLLVYQLFKFRMI